MDYDNRSPIYLQVIEQIKQDIVTGRLKLGDKMPSTRELAVDKGINANTAARIYKELEQMEITFTKRGIGTFISESDTLYQSLKDELSSRYVEQFLDRMHSIGYQQEGIMQLIKNYEEKE